MTGFFDSRWVHADGVAEIEAGGLPDGFRANGVACGIKPSGGLDLGLLVSDAPATTSAALFTRSATAAPPVALCRERVRLDAVRAVVVNSGNANAATGRRGYDDAARCQGAAAMLAGVPADQVAVASTGVIGVPLESDRIVSGLARLRLDLSQTGDGVFAEAIRTTDAFPKQCVVEAAGVRIAAQAKGAGMIQPGFATLLCFVQTDAVIPPGDADALLRMAADASFERITVDGQLSTNDMLLLMASGASGVAWDDDHQAALSAILRRLALLVVADGEGSKRIGRVAVSAAGRAEAETVARAVGNSPLVKTALHGGDPNWGRIVQAVGAALPGRALEQLAIRIEGVDVCRRGAFVPHDGEALTAAVGQDEVEYEIALDGDYTAGANAEVFFADFGHEYIRINAEYTT